MPSPKDVEKAIVEFFLKSGDFNGLPMRAFSRTSTDGKDLNAVISGLVREGRINGCFASVSVNPHIKRRPDLPIEGQLALLESESSDGICLYPSSDLVCEHFDVRTFDDRPFAQKLLLGAAQLHWEGFDLGVLDRYSNDPRYLFRFEDHGGRLSIEDSANEDSSFAERDKVLLQTFGVGYDESDDRVAVVFLRYLSNLSPDHQQYWKTFIRPGKIKLHREYYRSSLLGEFPEYGSYFGAMLKGTLTLLEEWLRGKIRWDDEKEAVKVIIEPLKRVRKLRRRPAHKLEEDRFSRDYDKQQYEIIRDVCLALSNFRNTLAGHPEAPSIRVPSWITEGKIAFA